MPKMGFMLWYRMYARDAAWYSGSIVKGNLGFTIDVSMKKKRKRVERESKGI
jgi:hypothetical protein